MDVVVEVVKEGVAVAVAVVVLVNVKDSVADADPLTVGDVVDDLVAVNETVVVPVLDMVDEALPV